MSSIEKQILGHLAMNPGGLGASQLRAELVPQLSQPTLWRRLDELRAKGLVQRCGRGRATRYYHVDSDHAISDLRSQALHREVGRKLLRQPHLLEQSRNRLRRMQHTMPYAKPYLDQWDALLAGPMAGVLRVLGGADEQSKALRHVSPFAGVLSAQERLAILARQGLMR